jgi:hypothetical protein
MTVRDMMMMCKQAVVGAVGLCPAGRVRGNGGKSLSDRVPGRAEDGSALVVSRLPQFSVNTMARSIPATTIPGLLDRGWGPLGLGLPDRGHGPIASAPGRTMSTYTSPAALRSHTSPTSDAHAFVRPADTVYITAPIDRYRGYAPLIAGFLTSARPAQHRRQAVDPGGETQTAPVTFTRAETADPASIPLPTWFSRPARQSMHPAVAFQHLPQARARRGHTASEFLTRFPR